MCVRVVGGCLLEMELVRRYYCATNCLVIAAPDELGHRPGHSSEASASEQGERTAAATCTLPFHLRPPARMHVSGPALLFFSVRPNTEEDGSLPPPWLIRLSIEVTYLLLSQSPP